MLCDSFSQQNNVILDCCHAVMTLEQVCHSFLKYFWGGRNPQRQSAEAETATGGDKSCEPRTVWVLPITT